MLLVVIHSQHEPRRGQKSSSAASEKEREKKKRKDGQAGAGRPSGLHRIGAESPTRPPMQFVARVSTPRLVYAGSIKPLPCPALSPVHGADLGPSLILRRSSLFDCGCPTRRGTVGPSPAPQQ